MKGIYNAKKKILARKTDTPYKNKKKNVKELIV